MILKPMTRKLNVSEKRVKKRKRKRARRNVRKSVTNQYQVLKIYPKMIQFLMMIWII